jgi:hypothetical protein
MVPFPAPSRRCPPLSAPPLPRQLLVETLPPGRLVLYPQLWWAALALLHSPHVAVYRAALGLVAACLGAGEAGGGGQQLRLAASKVQAVLLAAAPGLSAGQLLAASHAAAMQDSSEGPGATCSVGPGRGP